MHTISNDPTPIAFISSTTLRKNSEVRGGFENTFFKKMKYSPIVSKKFLIMIPLFEFAKVRFFCDFLAFCFFQKK